MAVSAYRLGVIRFRPGAQHWSRSRPLLWPFFRPSFVVFLLFCVDGQVLSGVFRRSNSVSSCKPPYGRAGGVRRSAIAPVPQRQLRRHKKTGRSAWKCRRPVLVQRLAGTMSGWRRLFASNISTNRSRGGDCPGCDHREVCPWLRSL